MEDIASIALLLRKQEPCLGKEALPSHFLIAVCDRQMNNINSSTKGRIRQQIESSSCITEAIIMGTASMKECLYVVWDRLQDLYELWRNSERESLSQQLQEKYKGAHTCRERKKHSDTECSTQWKCWMWALIQVALWIHFNPEFQPELLMCRRAKLALTQKNSNLCLYGVTPST